MPTKTLAKRSDLVPSVFNEFFKPWNEWFSGSKDELFGNVLKVPAVNIEENKDNFMVSLAAPGLKKDDFQIDIDGDILTISSEKEEEKEKKEEKYYCKEYNYSSFSRSFTLPDGVIVDKIDAKYEDGVLKLTMPKSEEAKKLAPQKIAVK
ncbi:MAG TPA: Hsp20/alpha crystallin family protein [Hanamia sp.]